MGLITFRCTSCNQIIKIGTDKAGRKLKCKCGTVLTIPAADPEEDKVMAAAEAPPKADEADEDTQKSYGLITDSSAPIEEKNKPEAKSKKDDKKPPPLVRKFKTLPDPELWEKVKAGLQIMMIGAYIWAGVVLFMGIIMIFCMTSGPEYGTVVEGAMPEAVDGNPGAAATPHMPTMMLGLVVGLEKFGTARTLYILAVVLSLIQGLVFLAGFGVCLKIPDRFGTQGQLKALLGLGGFNLLIVLVFKFLPMMGASNYFLVPYAMPEVSLVDAGINRDPPLWIFWSSAPFWEMILNVIILLTFYLEIVLIGVFVWSIGMALKEDPLVKKGQSVVNLAFGIAFTLLGFNLLSMAGTSGVALGVLRVIYGGWIFFTILLLIRLPLVLQATRAIIQGYLDGAEIKDDEEEEEEEEEKPKSKPKKKAKRPRDDEDDDD